jgi:nucleotide-binding universal stress UspA family protein
MNTTTPGRVRSANEALEDMKILLALDGSEPSGLARDLVANLSWPSETSVHLLSAYRPSIDYTGGVGSAMVWVGQVEDAIRDHLTEMLAEMGAPLAARGLAVEQSLVRGRAGDAILDTAREIGADLIITGSRGRGPVRSMLLGSAAAEVAANAPCPVLVARGASVSRLLVATDGSPNAGMIPELIGAWGSFKGIPADVVSVVPQDPPGFELMAAVYTLGNDRLEEQRREEALAAGRTANEAAARMTERSMPATSHVRSGDPANEILQAAVELQSDLVVTGSRGLGGLERLVLGSVARNVLIQAPCSVLIVRSDAAVQPARD